MSEPQWERQVLEIVMRRGTATAREIEEDWLQAFIEYASKVSDHSLREVWAQILANQGCEKRARVSFATIDSLRLLEPHLARALLRALQAWLVFGQCLDVVEAAPDETGSLRLYDLHYHALCGIGLLELRSSQQTSLTFKEFVWSFHDDDGGASASGGGRISGIGIVGGIGLNVVNSGLIEALGGFAVSITGGSVRLIEPKINGQENERVRKRACFGDVSLFKVVQKGKQKSCTRRNFSLQEDSQQHHQCQRKKGREEISRILSRLKKAADGHSSKGVVTDRLKQPLRAQRTTA